MPRLNFQIHLNIFICHLSNLLTVLWIVVSSLKTKRIKTTIKPPNYSVSHGIYNLVYVAVNCICNCYSQLKRRGILDLFLKFSFISLRPKEVLSGDHYTYLYFKNSHWMNQSPTRIKPLISQIEKAHCTRLKWSKNASGRGGSTSLGGTRSWTTEIVTVVKTKQQSA